MGRILIISMPPCGHGSTVQDDDRLCGVTDAFVAVRSGRRRPCRGIDVQRSGNRLTVRMGRAAWRSGRVVAMSGSKNKNQAPAQPKLPAALQGPPINAAPAPQPLPGQMEAIASQLSQGFPSMPQAEMLQRLQSIYRPPPAPAPALGPAVPTASAARGRVPIPGDRGYQGGMINSLGDFARLIQSAQQRRAGG